MAYTLKDDDDDDDDDNDSLFYKLHYIITKLSRVTSTLIGRYYFNT
jgi:hypothetical protein